MTTTDDRLAHPDLQVRLDALRALAAATPRPAPRGTNTHVHTNYSFSAFRSPAEAAWLAWQEGVEVFGINDHYTVDGHDEFRAACAILDLPATFSIEAVAMDRQAANEGVLLNDPGNPGRVYFSGKGVTDAGNPAAATRLAALREQQATRNRAMIAACDRHFHDQLDAAGPSWQAVIDQTPCGNTTERHIAKACVQRCHELAADGTSDFADLFTRLTGSEPAADDAAQQNQLRSALLKAGKPCYVAEDPDAYPSLQDLRQLYLQLGAIPTYPVLGNPITGGEEDVTALADRLHAAGIHALELIPARNTAERVAAVLAEAERRGWPVFDGTEHNTPSMAPLLTEWGCDPRFRPTFRRSAAVLLGHQDRIAAGLSGFVDGTGAPVPGGLDACLTAGEARLAAV